MTVTHHESSTPTLSLDRIRVCILVARDLTVLNISQNGLAVQTEKPLTMGKIYSLQLCCMDQSVSLDGEVARCNLSQLADSGVGEHTPLYLNGIHFQLERNPLELSLLEILYDNMAEDKRRSSRIKPLRKMIVDIGRPCFKSIKQFSIEGMLLESTELIDLDLDWQLLLQADGRAQTLSARVLHASKKTDEPHYTIQVEFINLDEEQTAFVQSLLRRLPN